MKSLFIIETTDALHSTDLADTLYKVLNVNFVTKLVLAKSKSDNFIKYSDLPFIILPGYINILWLLYKNKESNFIFNTVSIRNVFPLFLMTMVSGNCYFYAHNLSSWFMHDASQKSLLYKALGIWGVSFRKLILKRAKGIIVANSNMKEYLASRDVEPKRIHVIPFRTLEEKEVGDLNIKEFSHLRIVVPGAIDLRKKDLSILRDAILTMPSYQQKKIDVILLGKTVGKDDLIFCKDWDSRTDCSLKYYREFVSSEDFKLEMYRSHIIFGSLNVIYKDKYHSEIYGVSKDSGLDAQAYAFAKPLLINFDFNVVKEYVSATLYYKSVGDIRRALENLTIPEHYLEISRSAKESAKFISLDKLQTSSKEYFNQMEIK